MSTSGEIKLLEVSEVRPADVVGGCSHGSGRQKKELEASWRQRWLGRGSQWDGMVGAQASRCSSSHLAPTSPFSNTTDSEATKVIFIFRQVAIGVQE